MSHYTTFYYVWRPSITVIFCFNTKKITLYINESNILLIKISNDQTMNVRTVPLIPILQIGQFFKAGVHLTQETR